jgi:hypothetical protein
VPKPINRFDAIPARAQGLEQLAVGSPRKTVAVRKDNQGNRRMVSAHLLDRGNLVAAVANL